MTWLPTLLGGPVRHWREVGKREREGCCFRGVQVEKWSRQRKTQTLSKLKTNQNRKQAPFASVTYFIGGFLPLWLQDVLLSWSGGLIESK